MKNNAEADMSEFSTVNRIPSLTWNRLHLNEAEGVSVNASSFYKASFTIPSAVKTEELSETSLKNQKSGVGPEIDKAVSIISSKGQAITKFVSSVEKADAEETENILKIDFKYEGASINAVSPFEIFVEDGKALTVIMFFEADEDAKGEAVVQTKYHIGKNASLNLIQVQKTSKNMDFFNDIGGSVEDEGEFMLSQLVIDGGNSYLGSTTDLSGEKASHTMKLSYLVGKGSLLDINDEINHIGKKTLSEIEVNGVLDGSSKKNFRGTIDLRRGCKGAKGNERESVLLLDDDLENRTLPVILCSEEEVEGNHGASIGKLDSEMMFYLESRGIPEKEIYKMISRARIDAVKNLIPDAASRERIDGML